MNQAYRHGYIAGGVLVLASIFILFIPYLNLSPEDGALAFALVVAPYVAFQISLAYFLLSFIAARDGQQTLAYSATTVMGYAYTVIALQLLLVYVNEYTQFVSGHRILGENFSEMTNGALEIIIFLTAIPATLFAYSVITHRAVYGAAIFAVAILPFLAQFFVWSPWPVIVIALIGLYALYHAQTGYSLTATRSTPSL